MTQKSELGKSGEDIACEYLKKKGYRIIERNFRKPWGELDIISRASDKTLVFVEVKTSSVDFPSAEDQMTGKKIKKFKKAASLYAGHRQELVSDRRGFRLDVIAIAFKNENDYEITHYENAC